MILLTGAASVSVAAPRAGSLDKAGRSALYLLRQATASTPSGKRNQLLLGLRVLDDPTLKPLFISLSQSSEAALRLHGILGLAELASDHHVDLAAVAQVKNPAAQAKLITAAMESNLLSNAQAWQLFTWAGVDVSVKELIAAHLIGADEHHPTDPITPGNQSKHIAQFKETLHTAVKSENLGQRCLAALLLHELGDGSALHILADLEQSPDSQRDTVRAMLLRTTSRFDLTSAAAWADHLSMEPGASDDLQRLALWTALKLGSSEARSQWLKRYRSVDDPAQRVRLALIALDASPHLPVEFKGFDAMIASDRELIHCMGLAGRAAARIRTRTTKVDDKDQPDRDASAIIALLSMPQPEVVAWTLKYVRDNDGLPDGQRILLAVIHGVDQARGSDSHHVALSRFNGAVKATRELVQGYPDVADSRLRAILADRKTSGRLTLAILLGLARCRSDTSAIVSGLPSFSDPGARDLALLLLARGNKPLDRKQMDVLRILVRGGGRLEPGLRIQGAWSYLRRTGQIPAALAALVKR